MSNLEAYKKDKQLLISELEIAGAVFSGNAYKCVHHSDSRASAGVFEGDDGWHFKCQACGAKGDVFDIMAKNEGKTVKEVLSVFNQPTDKSMTREQLISKMREGKKKIYEYFNLDGSIYCLVCRSDTSTGKEIKQARPVGDKFEWGGAKKPSVLYNALEVVKNDTVIVVEGEKAADALIEAGFCATTSLQGAQSPQTADWSILKDKNIILWPDNDEAGKQYIKTVKEILDSIETKSIKSVDIEKLDLKEKDDAFDFIGQYDKSDVKAVLDFVFTDVLISDYDCVVKSLATRFIQRGKREIETIPFSLDRLTDYTNALQPGSLTMICGNPGAKKSLFLIQQLSFWIVKGYKVACYMLEKDKDFHIERAFIQQSGLTNVLNADWCEANLDKIGELPFEYAWILGELGKSLTVSDVGFPSLETVGDWIEAKCKSGNRIVCVDPVTLADLEGGKPWEVEKAFFVRLGQCSKKYGSSIILLTHPTKQVGFPDMNSMAGSAIYSRACDTVIWLESHQEKTSNIKYGDTTEPREHELSVHLLKTRTGKGVGTTFAYEFESNFTIKEIGIIDKSKKKKE